MFTSFLFEPFFGIVNLGEGVVRGLGGWSNKVTVTTAEDIGKLTADLAFAEPRIRAVVYTAGQTISYAKLADLVENLTGKTVRREEWSVEAMRTKLQENPDDVVQKYRCVFAEGKGVSWDMEQTYNFQRGIKTEDIKSWAMKNIIKRG
jgi:hypothetical protein